MYAYGCLPSCVYICVLIGACVCYMHSNPNYSIQQSDIFFTYVRRNSLVCMWVYQFDHMYSYGFIWETGIRFKKFTSTCSLSQQRRWNASSPAVNRPHHRVPGLPEHALHAIFFVSCWNQLIRSFLEGPSNFALMALLWCCTCGFRSRLWLQWALDARKRWERHRFHSLQGPGCCLWPAGQHTSLAMFYGALKNEGGAKKSASFTRWYRPWNSTTQVGSGQLTVYVPPCTLWYHLQQAIAKDFGA